MRAVERKERDRRTGALNIAKIQNRETLQYDHVELSYNNMYLQGICSFLERELQTKPVGNPDHSFLPAEACSSRFIAIWF